MEIVMGLVFNAMLPKGDYLNRVTYVLVIRFIIYSGL